MVHLKLWFLFIACSVLFLQNIPQTNASPASSVESRELAIEVLKRLYAIQRRSNPTGSYTPSKEACPATNSSSDYTGFIRSSQNGSISYNETAYIQRHQQQTQQMWTEWLQSSNPGPNLNSAIAGGVQNYTSDIDRLPRVGIALSGGGYRAMIDGSGVLQGWDERNQTAKDRGVAGILQMANYVAGLSGGSWAVGSFAINDWPTTQSQLLENWNLPNNLIIPEDDTISFYADIVTQVAGKRIEGFPTGIVDYWGRALSYHLLNSTYPNHGTGTTFTDIQNTTNFQQASFPFPVVIADEREPGQLLIDRNTTLFEFNPFEFGSYDPDVSAFVPMSILGTDLVNGASAEQNNQCVYGFDNFGWVVGTSSTLFNGLFNILITSHGDSIIKDALESILGAISSEDNDVSVLPNPFRGYNANDPNVTISSLQNITLVDGGEDNQNVPINTLLLPDRKLDLILAVDSSADTTDWPNGTSLYETYLRYKNNAQYDFIPMPIIPTANTFLNRGLNTRPTFFGCNATSTNGEQVDVINSQAGIAPIIAYIPNYPYSYLSNTSTYQLQYDNATAQLMIDNGVDVASMGGATQSNSSIYWPTCLACAALERGFARSNTVRPDVCQRCLQAYCWDGITNDTTPDYAYSPAVGNPFFIQSQGEKLSEPPFTGGNGSNADQQQAIDGFSSGTSSSAGTNGAYNVALSLNLISTSVFASCIALTVAFIL